MTEEAPSHRIIESRGEFHEVLRDAFVKIADAGCREVFISDTDFADWPISERGVIEQLTRWAYAHRKLVMLAQNFDDMPRRHPRFTEWRRQWAHVIQCRSLAETVPGELPGLFLAPGCITVKLLDPVRYRASISESEADAIRARDTFDALLQRSEEAFPATTLGL